MRVLRRAANAPQAIKLCAFMDIKTAVMRPKWLSVNNIFVEYSLGIKFDTKRA